MEQDNAIKRLLDEGGGIRSIDEINSRIEELEGIVITTAKRSEFNNSQDIDDTVNMFFYQRAKHKIEALKWVLNESFSG